MTYDLWQASSDPIAALSMLCYTSGSALGPIFSGALVEAVGFRHACSVCGLAIIGTALLVQVVVGVARCRRGGVRGRRLRPTCGLASQDATMQDYSQRDSQTRAEPLLA